MRHQTLGSTAANYPYLQGLWTIPLGFGMVLAGISNLERRPAAPLMSGILVVGLALAGTASLLITRYYRINYGQVTPTRSRHVRHGIALVAWIAVLFVGANRYLLWSADSSICIYASAFALATLAYYAILVGLRAHHVVIWGLVFLAGVLPVWGGLGADRDALAMFPLGAALIVSGVLDQRLLIRDLGSAASVNAENSNVGE